MKKPKRYYVWWLDRAGRWIRGIDKKLDQLSAEADAEERLASEDFRKATGLVTYEVLPDGDKPAIGEIAG